MCSMLAIPDVQLVEHVSTELRNLETTTVLYWYDFGDQEGQRKDQAVRKGRAS